eukprot:74284_1
MASLRPKRSSINTKTRYTDLQNQIFIESIIGLNIIVNPIYVQRSNLWDIDWNVQGSKNSSGIGMSKDPKILWASVCFAAEEDEQDESYWCVAAEEDEKDDSLTIYDISAGIILDFEWFRNAILKYVSTQNATSSALKLWMTDKCQDLRKYKKKAKRYRHKAVKSMVDVMKCLMQYGAYLGFFISSTLNQCGQKQQNSRHIKMPLIVWNKANLFDDFISYSQFKYSKNGGKYHVFCCDKAEELSNWLIKQYVEVKDEYGTWDIIQVILSYNESNQILMIKYDVRLRDHRGREHFIYRDILSQNPKCKDRSKVKCLVNGFIRKHMFIPYILHELIFLFRFDEDSLRELF